MSRLKHPATIVAGIALFVALGGWATAAGVLISGSQIKNHSIPKKKLTNSAIASLKGQKGDPGIPGDPGEPGAKGDQGDPGPSNAYSAFNSSQVNFGSSNLSVVSMGLGPGTYVVMANTTVFNTTDEDNIVCRLYNGMTLLDTSAVEVRNATGLPGGQAEASLLAPVTVFMIGDATVRCQGSSSGSTSVNARVMAIKVGSLSGS